MKKFLTLIALLWVWCVPLHAQDDGDAGGGAGPGPEGADPAGLPNPGVDDAAANPNGGLAAPEADNGFNFAPQGERLAVDLGEFGFSFDDAAFAIFPEAVRSDIRGLVSELLPLLEAGREKDLQKFFDNEGQRIATVFDQLGVERSADGLLASADGQRRTQFTFPSEFTDYEAYLNTLDLDPFEREYMLESHNVAQVYRQEIASGGENLQQALEAYQQQLEELNDRFAEQFREKYLESLDGPDAGGGRPDIDR